ncbi:MAG: L-rhamnose/proton symporter RhaT [Candidatus Acidiferrales bacterium]
METAWALSILVLAGFMNGSFTLPMKFTKRWAWENTWFAWTIFALVIFPPALTLLTVPSLGAVYSQSGITPILLAASFGAAWGISQVFLGLAVSAIGMALSFSVILGISAGVGSLVPLIRFHPERIFTRGGLALFAGLALVLIGVGICAVAGRHREIAQGKASDPAQTSVAMGLLYCTISGVGSAFVNLGLAFGGPLVTAARAAGANPQWAPNAVWLPLMMAGGIPNLIYCVYLMKKNKTAGGFGISGTGFYWLLAAVMAFFWFGSTVMYGVSTVKLGALGAVLAWPLFMSLIVLSATFWGFATGEWKNSGRGAVRVMSFGIAVLIAAIIVLSIASRWA